MNVGRLLGETGHDSDLLRVLIHPVDPNGLALRPASSLLRKLWGQRIQAMTIKNWIFVDPIYLNGDRARLARLAIHELVHARQWRDLGVVGFLGRYAREYLQGRRQGLAHRDAYMNISLEEEARRVQARLIS